ncbi:MAG: alpha/beta hydrolase [Chloroflexota bacterium]
MTKRKQNKQRGLSRYVLPLLLGGAGAAMLYRQYQQDRADADRTRRLGSRLIETRLGTVEYAERGTGIPVLLFHGSGTGYQHLDLLPHFYDTSVYRLMSFSRPGYLRTLQNVAPSAGEQADLAAAVLDANGCYDAHIIAISSGGLPALSFAQRHRDRCLTLTMLSAVTPLYSTPDLADTAEQFISWATQQDFLFWLALNLGGRSAVLRSNGASPSDLPDDKAFAIIDTVRDTVFPPSVWSSGLQNDIRILKAFNPDSITDITAPSLFIHGTDDLAASYENARETASNLPTSRFLTIDGGTHFVIATHHREIGLAIGDMLTEYA